MLTSPLKDSLRGYFDFSLDCEFTASSQIPAPVVQRIQGQCAEDSEATKQATTGRDTNVNEHGPTEKNSREAQIGSGEVVGREERGRMLGIREGHIHEHALHDYEGSTNVESDSNDTGNPVDRLTSRPRYVHTLLVSNELRDYDTAKLTEQEYRNWDTGPHVHGRQ
jgi:hypothetical protein